MFASRHHSRRTKSCQLSRATSTLKHSSNQKGFRARKRKRNAEAAAASKTRVDIATGVDVVGEREWLVSAACWFSEVWFGEVRFTAVWFTAILLGTIPDRELNVRIPDDTMLKMPGRRDPRFANSGFHA